MTTGNWSFPAVELNNNVFNLLKTNLWKKIGKNGFRESVSLGIF